MARKGSRLAQVRLQPPAKTRPRKTSREVGESGSGNILQMSHKHENLHKNRGGGPGVFSSGSRHEVHSAPNRVRSVKSIRGDIEEVRRQGDIRADPAGVWGLRPTQHLGSARNVIRRGHRSEEIQVTCEECDAEESSVEIQVA